MSSGKSRPNLQPIQALIQYVNGWSYTSSPPIHLQSVGLLHRRCWYSEQCRREHWYIPMFRINILLSSSGHIPVSRHGVTIQKTISWPLWESQIEYFLSFIACGTRSESGLILENFRFRMRSTPAWVILAAWTESSPRWRNVCRAVQRVFFTLDE